MASSNGGGLSNNSDKNRKPNYGGCIKCRITNKNQPLTIEEIENWKKDPYRDPCPCQEWANSNQDENQLKLTELYKEDLDEFKANPFRPSQRGTFSHSSLIPQRSRECPGPSSWPENHRNTSNFSLCFISN